MRRKIFSTLLSLSDAWLPWFLNNLEILEIGIFSNINAGLTKSYPVHFSYFTSFHLRILPVLQNEWSIVLGNDEFENIPINIRHAEYF